MSARRATVPGVRTSQDGTAGPGGPGLLHRAALGTYARLPRLVRLQLLRTFAPSHTVGALVFLEHDGAVLVLQQRHRHGWTLPGGLIDRGEGVHEAAVREVREETGLAVEVGVPLTTVVDPDVRRVDVLFHVPLASRPEVVPRSEATRAAWLRADELGAVDEPTAMAFAAFAAARRPGAAVGRLLA